MGKRFAIVLAYVCLTACSSATPGGPSPVTTTTTVPATWSLSAPIVSTLTGQNLGTFSASGQGVRPTQRVTIDAPGYVSRQTTLSAGTEAPVFDLFPSSALDFYRQMVRDGFEAPGLLQTVIRWTSAPKFYISQDGSLSPEDIRRVTLGILTASQQVTPFGPVGIDVGPPRADQVGWVTVAFPIQPSVPHCGVALVGSNPGHIDINLKASCAGFCRNSKIITGGIVHEVGHAFGYFHTNAGRMSVTQPFTDADCQDTVGFTPAERQAAQIAYQRPVGNRDPDIDPDGRAF